MRSISIVEANKGKDDREEIDASREIFGRFNHMSLSNIRSFPKFRYPFIRPRLPSLDRVAVEFQRSRDASFYSNFGPTALVFEGEMEKAYFPGMAAVSCSNCTSGLSAALIAYRIKGPVLVPAFTFPATSAAVRGAGLRAVIGDVDPETGILDPVTAEPLIREHGCEAVIVVRPYGLWSDISAIAELCARLEVRLIIDNAAGIGADADIVARYSIPSALEVFSLHATKPFGVGEGGLCVVPTAEQHNLRSALNFGLWSLGELEAGEGINGKMDELTASMALVVFEDLPGRIKERQRVAARYLDLAEEAGLETFPTPERERSAPWQCFPVKLPLGLSAARVTEACFAEGLQVRRYYHPALSPRTARTLTPNAHALAERAICLPVYDGSDLAETDAIWAVFRAAMKAVA